MSEYAGDYPDPRGLSHAQRLDLLARVQRDRAALDAMQARILAAIDPDREPSGTSAGSWTSISTVKRSRSF